MQVVNEEENGASGIGACQPRNDRLAARSISLQRFATNAINDPIKKQDWVRLCINAQLEIFCPQVVNKFSALIKNGDAGLNQIRADAHDVVGRFLRLLVNLSFELRTRRLLFLSERGVLRVSEGWKKKKEV